MSDPDRSVSFAQLELAQALLAHIERPVALCDPGGRLVALNGLFHLELVQRGVPQGALGLGASGLIDAEGRGIPLPLIRSQLGSTPLLGSEWQLLELPGRVVSLPTLARILEDPHRGAVALLRVELRNASALLARLGSERYDALIETLERRLLGCLPQGATLCRDRDQALLALIPDPCDRQGLRLLARGWVETLSAPLPASLQQLLPQLSLGVSRAPEDGERFGQLYDAAGKDCGEAADDGGLRLAGALALAIDQQRLDLRYQPIVDMISGRIEAVEVLCRWCHPRIGMVSPGEFIAVAEASQQIHLLGEWLITAVFAQIRHWRDRQLRLDYVSINISPLQLQSDGLIETLCEGLRRHGLSAGGIMLEMTENRELATSAELRRRLWRLQDLGFTLAMDDYGTGYSSLQRLTSLPFRALKVDRCLIEAIETDPLQQAMLRGVGDLQQATGLRVVVEGVERPSQRQRLLELGCRTGQGYLFSHPISARQLEKQLLPQLKGTGPRQQTTG